jgi:hypothetical protein
VLAEGAAALADGAVGKLAAGGPALDVGGGGLDCAFNTSGVRMAPKNPATDHFAPKEDIPSSVPNGRQSGNSGWLRAEPLSH